MESAFFQQVLDSGAVDETAEIKEAIHKCKSAKELVEMFLLDEISNVRDALPEINLPNAIERYVIAAGGMTSRKMSTHSPKPEVTQRACFFVVYQTQRKGPQNGFRLCLVEKGVKPGIAFSLLSGDVAEDACEVVVVSP